MVGSGVGFCGKPDYSDHRLFLRINLIASRCSSGQHLQNQPFTDVFSQGHASVWRWRFSNRRLWLAESCHSQSYSEEATWSNEHACMYACCGVCTQAHAHEHRDHRRTLRFPFYILPPYSFKAGSCAGLGIMLAASKPQGSPDSIASHPLLECVQPSWSLYEDTQDLGSGLHAYILNFSAEWK